MKKQQLNVDLFAALSSRISTWDKHARVESIESKDKSRITHFIITQDVEEVDLHYDAWRSWIHVYLELIKEGFLALKWIDPPYANELEEVDKYLVRTQKSLISYDQNGADNRLAREIDNESNQVVINLDILGVLMTKKFMLDLTFSKNPDWRFARSIEHTQLTSYANLNEQDANGLLQEIKDKLKLLVGDKEINDDIIGIVTSRKTPGVYRVNIKLDALRDILPNRVPYEKVKEDVYAVKDSDKCTPGALQLLNVLSEMRKKESAISDQTAYEVGMK